MRHGLLIPPMYGMPGGLHGEITLPQILSDAGYVTQAVGKWNLEIDADVKSPNYVNNFFGWGNESVFDKNIDFYRVRFREYALELKLSRSLESCSSRPDRPTRR
jgi:arylsulfatase A-like enzyme